MVGVSKRFLYEGALVHAELPTHSWRQSAIRASVMPTGRERKIEGAGRRTRRSLLRRASIQASPPSAKLSAKSTSESLDLT